MMLRQRFSVSAGVRFAARKAAVSAVLLSIAVMWGCKGVSDKSIQEISGLELRKLYDSSHRKGNETELVLIDPRHPSQYAREHIPGARNFRLTDAPPEASVNRDISRFDTIVVYGNDPASAPARAMTKRMITIGYSGVRLFPGGLEEWKSLGGEVVGEVQQP